MGSEYNQKVICAAASSLHSGAAVRDCLLDPDRQRQPIKLVGKIRGPFSIPAGCRFHSRCSFAQDRCRSETPRWRAVDDDHQVACHFADELDLEGGWLISTEQKRCHILQSLLLSGPRYFSIV